ERNEEQAPSPSFYTSGVRRSTSSAVRRSSGTHRITGSDFAIPIFLTGSRLSGYGSILQGPRTLPIVFYSDVDGQYSPDPHLIVSVYLPSGSGRCTTKPASEELLTVLAPRKNPLKEQPLEAIR